MFEEHLSFNVLVVLIFLGFGRIESDSIKEKTVVKVVQIINQLTTGILFTLGIMLSVLPL